MKTWYARHLGRFLCAGLIWLGIASQAGAQSRGDLASVELVKSITAEDLRLELIDFFFRTLPEFPIDLFDALIPVTYGVDAYLPYVLLGYQEIYGNMYRDLSEVFVPPWDVDIPVLFDGSTKVDDIIAAMPVNWREMFRPEWLEAVETDPFHPVRRALRDNDLLDFAPRSDLLMLYCTGDEQVSFWNAIIAQIYFKWIRQIPGFSVALPVGPLAHRDCVPLAMVAAKFNFDNQRK